MIVGMQITSINEAADSHIVVWHTTYTIVDASTETTPKQENYITNNLLSHHKKRYLFRFIDDNN